MDNNLEQPIPQSQLNQPIIQQSSIQQAINKQPSSGSKWKLILFILILLIVVFGEVTYYLVIKQNQQVGLGTSDKQNQIAAQSQQKQITPTLVLPTSTPIPPTPTPVPPTNTPTPALCNVDFSESPSMAAFADIAVKLCDNNYLKIKQKLGDNRPQSKILLVLKRTQTNPGETSDHTINLSSDWFTKNPSDLGAIIHEMAHVFQGYPGGSPFWLQEGIADYIRYWDGYKNSWSYAHCGPGSESYTSGYWCSAAFLQYIERVYDKNIIAELNNVLRESGYSDSLFNKYTGKDLPSLWTECKNSDCVGGS